ncbi:ROK family protein [Glaciihabitans sp. dw_435]|uniref:ROK family protein n=1 Tax=Glaciihabitans sp. dw_435 TaxID=2720081 RepID=UPI001BD20E3E|nr:ROK family protein [Glaciihabitans sp. dw_435]
MTHPHQPERLPVALAIDIGGTTLKGAAVDRDGRVVTESTVGTFAVGDNAFAGVRALLRLLHTEAEDLGHAPAGIGIASPGLVDAATGTIVFAANLGWNTLPLKSLLEQEFGVPVHVEHDARAGAIAERAAHADDHAAFRDFIFIPIGTGVSAAVVTSGMLVVGATGAAGEFGHMPVIPGGELCTCGQHGCIEVYASASNILARYGKLGGTSATSTPDIAASIATDPIAARVWADAVDALAIGIVSLSAVLDPSAVVVGGGLSRAGDLLLDPLRSLVGRRLTWRTVPRILQSALDSEAGLVGAAVLGWSGTPLDNDFALSLHRELIGSDSRADRAIGVIGG